MNILNLLVNKKIIPSTFLFVRIYINTSRFIVHNYFYKIIMLMLNNIIHYKIDICN